MRIAMVGGFGLFPRMTMRARALPLAQELAHRGHNILMVMPPWHTPEEGGRRWDHDGVQMEYVPIGREPRVISVVATPWRLLGRVRAFHPDVVHVFKPRAFAGASTRLLWELGRISSASPPIIVDQDDWDGLGGWADRSPYPRMLDRMMDRQERWCLRHADAITVASKTLETLVWSLGVAPERVHYLPNGARFRGRGDGKRIRRLYDIGDQPVVLLYTRFFEYDPVRAVEVFAQIRQCLPAARMLVVGEALYDRDEERFAQAVGSAGLDGRVVQAGWVDETELSDHFAAADVAIYPFDDTLINRSKCPVKLVDLLIHGVPVIADAVGEIVQYIRHKESGLLVPHGDTASMAAAVIELLEDAPRRQKLGLTAAQDARTRFGFDDLADRLLQVYALATGLETETPA